MYDRPTTSNERAEIRAAFLRAILSLDHPRRPPAVSRADDEDEPPQEPGASPSDSPTRIA